MSVLKTRKTLSGEHSTINHMELIVFIRRLWKKTTYKQESTVHNFRPINQYILVDYLERYIACKFVPEI